MRFWEIKQYKFEYSIEECVEIRDWFKELGRRRDERFVRIWSDKEKGKNLKSYGKKEENKFKKKDCIERL